MAHCALSIEPAIGIYRGNALGLNEPTSNKGLGKPKGKGLATPWQQQGVIRLREYESFRVCGFTATPTDGMPGCAYGTMRVVRSRDGFAVGVATCSDTGLPCGFLLKIIADDSGGSKHVVVARLQQCFSTGRSYVLVRPRALVVRHGGKTVTVVGDGTVWLGGRKRKGRPAARGVFPGIAHVNVQPPCGGPFEAKVFLGSSCSGKAAEHYNEDDDDDDGGGSSEGRSRGGSVHGSASSASEATCDGNSDIVYYDIIKTPEDGTSLYVCGAINSVAAVFVVSDAYGVILKTARLRCSSTPSLASCLVLSACRKLLIVGVQTDDTSLLWALAADTMHDIRSLATCAFNDRHTNRLRLPHDIERVEVFKLFALPCGSVLAVATAWGCARSRPGSPSTLSRPSPPLSAVAVYKFTRDTQPDVGYGIEGISVWSDVQGTQSRPCDAFQYRDNLYVVGNTYATSSPEPEEGTGESLETASVVTESSFSSSSSLAESYVIGSASFVNPCLPFLTVDAPGSLPEPFLVQFRGNGVPCVIFHDLESCAEAVFANTVCLNPGSPAGLLVLGDTFFHVGKPGQAAGMLLLDIALTQPPRLMNGYATAVPVIDYGCVACDPITIDRRCGESTTLQVAGPVVVGGPSEDCVAIFPGAIAYDKTTNAFIGFDGTSWKQFQMVTATPAPVT